jgi:putative endonuclease
LKNGYLRKNHKSKIINKKQADPSTLLEVTMACFFMLKYKQKLGAWGELVAKNHYQKLGYEILAQNFYTRYGELDLVLKKNNKILVVEVKTRTSQKFGFGEESVSQKKLQNIYKAWNIFKVQNSLNQFCDIEICVIEKKNNASYLQRFLI